MSVANGALAMPYPGLRPFEGKDQPLFFGREAQVSAMLHQLEDHRFVAVVGSSGSGKSRWSARARPAVREGPSARRTGSRLSSNPATNPTSGLFARFRGDMSQEDARVIPRMTTPPVSQIPHDAAANGPRV
jgi:ABC-type dipeptide/oligopeptide/nickel transport system ATPase component